MSIKRRAPNDLNHDNWDKEDPEPEPMGTFKSASKEVLEKRVIRTAKRTRTTFASGDEAKKNVFTGFGGFNKAPPSSFDFLSNLTNGNKTEGDSTKAQSEASATGSLFETNADNKICSAAAIPSTEGNSKHTFGMPTTQTAIFGSSIATSNNLKSQTTTSTPFKIQTTQVGVKSPEFPIKTPETNSVSPPKISASIFGSNFQTSDTNKSIAGNSTTPKPQMTPNSTSNSTPATLPGISNNENKANNIKDEKKNMYYSKIKGLNESVSEWIYKHVKETPLCILTPIFKDYEKYLKDIQEEYEGANILQENKCDKTKTIHSMEKSVSENLSEPKSSSSILSSQTTSLFRNASNNPMSTGAVGPGFSFGINTSSDNVNTSNSSPLLASNTTNTPKSTSANGGGFSFGIKSSANTSNASTPLASNTPKDSNGGSADGNGFSFGVKTSSANTLNTSTPLASNTPFSTSETGSSFSFGIKTSSANTTNTSNTSLTPFASTTAMSTGATGSGFPFGINTSSTNTVSTSNASTPFSFTTNTTLSANSKMPFSFGSDKPFSFSSNVQKPVEKTENDKEEDDEPPKVEYTPVVEENSVFETKCKIFVKKEDTFVDKGVGTLYIKKVEESGKHQLLVRANTNLGNVLLNLILSSAIPLQRTGKNNVMMVCIPNPDAQPPPKPVLIRVKTSDDADKLLEMLNKYKS